MHCLEVIIERNAKAAGREAAHADNDGNDRLASAIHNTFDDDTARFSRPDWIAFNEGYLDGSREG